MNPVEQRRVWRPADHPDGAQRGDCAAACVASIFEMSYEACADIDGTTRSVADWTKRHYHGVFAEHRMLGGGWEGPETLDSYTSWPTVHHEQGFWMAAVWSPRIPDIETFDCGCAYDEDGSSRPADPDCKWCGGRPETRSMGIAWGLHAVVMEGARLVWDPHPERADGPLFFRGATTWRVSNPARLTPRCTKGDCGEGLIDPADCYHRKAA